MPALAAQIQPPGLAALVARHDGRAPRYTSYPTAVQFTPQVDAATYRGWLKGLDPAEAVSLYVHVPFCARLCWYCGCNTRAVNRHEPVASYVDCLLDEAALLQAALPARLPASAVHLGGGTPNMLSPDELDALFGALRSIFAFTEEVEVAAELDPAYLTRHWVEAAARNGLSRASLGVQSLSPEVQAAINRAESFEEVEACIGWLRAAGVGSVNFDLMYGLPHQTVANVAASVRRLAELRPERVAIFGYAHVPWMKAHQKLIDEAALPGALARVEQYEAAAEVLDAAGYVRIGLDHFALPDDELAVAQAQGRLRRNFQGYTADGADTLLGLGASAIGAVPQGYVQNVADELAWRKAVAAGDLPVARGVALTPEDRLRADVIERLMCDLAVDLAEVRARHPEAAGGFRLDMEALAPFLHDSLLAIDGDRLQVTGRGRLFIRSICAAFDAYFAPQAGRHSKAL